MGWHTIHQGQAALIRSPDGTSELVNGPARRYLFRKRIEFLTAVTADQNQYLAIKFTDGSVQHKKGPACVFRNPLLHREITAKNAESLTAHEVLVVYRPSPVPETKDHEGYTANVDRTIVRGPCMHIPEPDEWPHQFVWHGTDPSNKGRKLYGTLKFYKLRIIPDQFYSDVEEVRTADDARVTVKVMVFFELVDLERMLKETHDPIGDFINSLSADVIAWAATRSYETFLAETQQLNALETYPQLVQRSERIGYRIVKVVYRGYHANDKLQRMMDNAIEARTSLRLEADTEEQAQTLADMKLQKEIERADKRRDMERRQKEHEQTLERMEHEQAMAQAKAKSDAELEFQRRSNQEKVTFLQALKAQDIDLTKYLVAQYQSPDKVFKIDMGASGSGNQPALHLHQNA